MIMLPRRLGQCVTTALFSTPCKAVLKGSPSLFPAIPSKAGVLYPAPPALYFSPVHPWGMLAAGPPAAVMVGSPPLHGNLTPPIASMDALKARIMDVAPGQVKQAICSAQFVPR